MNAEFLSQLIRYAALSYPAYLATGTDEQKRRRMAAGGMMWWR